MTDKPHVLYRMHDEHDTLLYVGITSNPAGRFQTHRGTQPWWDQVATIRLERFPDRASVERAESLAIRTENPVFNVAGRPPMGPRPPMKRDESRKPREPIGKYVGSAEVGIMFDVSRQRVQTIVNKSDFPPPYATLTVGKVWRTDDVKKWAEDHGRKIVEE